MDGSHCSDPTEYTAARRYVSVLSEIIKVPFITLTPALKLIEINTFLIMLIEKL